VANGDICFCIVFNHRFDANVPKLERIYKDRFDTLFFLMPLYTGANRQVLTVYENSVFFQGFFAQAFERLFAERYSHYVFIADDLILHPRLNAANLLDELGLTGDAAYIKSLTALADQTFKWPWQLGILNTVLNPEFVRTALAQELPSAEEAHARCRAHGVQVRDLAWSDLRALRGSGYKAYLRAISFLFSNRNNLSIPYPYVAGYSDFLIVPKHAIRQFCRYCGVFAAMNLFVEVAAPTALALACDRIVVEKDTKWRGREIWSEREISGFYAEHDNDLQRVLASYDDNQLYVHPLKLSKLKIDNIHNRKLPL
jgi:hypothetical protein